MASPREIPSREETQSPGQMKAMENRSTEWSEKWNPIHSAYMLIWHSDLQGAVNILGDSWRTNIWSAMGIAEVREGRNSQKWIDGGFTGQGGCMDKCHNGEGIVNT